MDILQKHFKKGSCPYAPLDVVLTVCVQLKEISKIIIDMVLIMPKHFA